MNVFVFDIETVPDVITGRRLLGLEGLSDEAVAAAMRILRRDSMVFGHSLQSFPLRSDTPGRYEPKMFTLSVRRTNKRKHQPQHATWLPSHRRPTVSVPLRGLSQTSRSPSDGIVKKLTRIRIAISRVSTRTLLC